MFSGFFGFGRFFFVRPLLKRGENMFFFKRIFPQVRLLSVSYELNEFVCNENGSAVCVLYFLNVGKRYTVVLELKSY